ncbi:MAG: hypothetical protein HC801_12745 [Nitrospira sp.]|nr:hypothetical protein [Nitrospira sp.]
MALEHRRSRWPERWPTADEIASARSALHRGQYHIYAREKECRITAPEFAAFKRTWLDGQYYERGDEPANLVKYLAIDPVPKPSAHEIATGMIRKDYEAFAIVGRDTHNGIWLLDYLQNRGHDPAWTRAKFMQLCMRHRPRLVGIDATAYQSTLAFILDEEMRARGIWFPIEEVRERRAKSSRIINAISDRAALGLLHVRRDQTEFLSAYDEYSDTRPPAHDDLLDAISLAIDCAMRYSPSAIGLKTGRGRNRLPLSIHPRPNCKSSWCGVLPMRAINQRGLRSRQETRGLKSSNA